MKLLNVVSRLCENKNLDISTAEYNDVIHGRITSGNSIMLQHLNDTPIQPYESNWGEVPDTFAQNTAITRTFEFINFKTLHYFINETLKYQERMQHHSQITIDHNIVTIILQTKDLEEVTEIDLQMAEYLDEIYKDTQQFYSVK
jgi:4a-hydroxytetrahydrobiopterin dehydratase